MTFESENYDIEAVRKITYDLPWTKAMPEKEKKRYFELLWNEYLNSDYFWVIESKTQGVVAHITIDADSEIEAHFYIHKSMTADLDGFGSQLLGKIVKYIKNDLSFDNLYVHLWDENDPSGRIYEEAGYEIDDGAVML